MLATVSGALVQRPGTGSTGSVHAAVAAAGGPDALQPLYVWQQEPGSVPVATAAAAAEPGAAPAGRASVPGPAWLQQLLLDLPLSSATAMAHSACVASAHLSCLRHVRQHCLLPAGGHAGGSNSSSSGTAALALYWQQAASAASACGYDGEFVARLAFSACSTALRLLQWLLLRLSVGRQVLPVNQAAGSSCGTGWDGAGRPAKRQRGAVGASADAAAGCEAVLGVCRHALHSEPGASLAAAAGEGAEAWVLRLCIAASASYVHSQAVQHMTLRSAMTPRTALYRRRAAPR